MVMPYARYKMVSEGHLDYATVHVFQYFSRDNIQAPMYPDSSKSILYSTPSRSLKFAGSKKLANLTADLSAISTNLIPVEKGKDGRDYYVLSYEIRVKFFSAHTEYSLWHKGKEYGKVDAEYA
jgi:hypothetical protein